jgi:hypothetical protein
VKKNVTRLLMAIGAAVAVGAAAHAQVPTLGVGSGRPVTDGTLSADEYQLAGHDGAFTVYLSRTPDTLSIGCAGDPRGWVAVGVGTLGMDHATIFMGSVVDGAPQFQVQLGGGHRHGGVPQQAIDSVVSHAVSRHADSMVMEIALKAGEYIAAGQQGLNLIYASGDTVAFDTIHVQRGAWAVALQ